MADKTLRVRFDPPGTPPAVLVAGDLTLAAGDTADLPVDIAQALLDDPAMNVHLASAAALAAATTPETGDDNPKEN